MSIESRFAQRCRYRGVGRRALMALGLKREYAPWWFAMARDAMQMERALFKYKFGVNLP